MFPGTTRTLNFQTQNLHFTRNPRWYLCQHVWETLTHELSILSVLLTLKLQFLISSLKPFLQLFVCGPHKWVLCILPVLSYIVLIS